MIDWTTRSDDEFRSTFRDWLRHNYPPEWRCTAARPFHRLREDQIVDWLRLVQRSGWRAPAWPTAYGGLGLSFAKQRIYQEELEHGQVARVLDFGEQMLGPILMQHGTPEQQQTLLPRILRCDDIWCQGYSEPNAGSDLASLTTSAVADGDVFVVNGQKIWTTHAQDSTHMFALVRTSRGERKQQGITFLLIDLASPGVRIRPIMNIAGEEEYCEVFLEDVRVPRENVVGEIDQGWSIAKELLGHERLWVGSPAMPRRAIQLAAQIIENAGLCGDLAVNDGLTALQMDLHDHEALYDEVCADVDAGTSTGVRAGMLKILSTELTQRASEFICSIVGNHAAVVGGSHIGALDVDVHWQLMMSRPLTIFGGANEVQRDILARQLLDLA